MSNIHKILSFSRGFKSLLVSPNYLAGSPEADRISRLHVSSSRLFPQAALRLPENVQDINASEVGQFSPQRSRDINGPAIISHRIQNEQAITTHIDITLNSDPHMASYDCRGTVSLSSSMQSNVPSPFSGNQSHLGMPGSQWGQSEKYLSEHLSNSHYLNLRNMYRGYHTMSSKRGILQFLEHRDMFCLTGGDLCKLYNFTSLVVVYNQTRSINDNTKTLTLGQKLKKAVTEYGATVIVFHIAISLASLGICYTLISSGLDLVAILEYLNLADEYSVKHFSNAGTFVVAYGVHKIFAPARIGTTLVVAPLIVKYLRKKGILKK